LSARGARANLARMSRWRELLRWDVAAALLIGLCAAFSLVQLLLYGFGRDQAIYAVVADELLHGAAPYAGAWDFKPPGIFFVFVLSRLFGRGEVAIRIVEVLAWLSLIYAGARLGRRHLGGALAGLWGGCLAAVVVSQLEFWHTAQPESFAAVALVWAVLLASSDGLSPRRQLAAWAGAGACYAAAGLLKFPLGGGLVITWILLCRRTGLRRSAPPLAGLRGALRPTLALGAGALAPVALTVAYFAAKGALRPLWDTLFVFTREYTRLGGWSVRAFLLGIYPALKDTLVGFSPLLLLGVLLLAALPRVAPLGQAAAHALGAFAFALLAVPLQGKLFAYHYAPALALCAIFAGLGYHAAFARARGLRGALTSVALLAVMAALFWHYPATRGTPIAYFDRVAMRARALRLPAPDRRQLLDRLSSAADVDNQQNREAAAWVAARTAPGSRLYVWGFEPALYDFSRRRPASRYIYNVPQRATWSAARYRPRLLADLAEQPPAAILVEKGDRYRWVTGDDRDSAEALGDFPELQALLARDYAIEKRSAKFDCYLRRGAR
jgi:hypothetical protein